MRKVPLLDVRVSQLPEIKFLHWKTMDVDSRLTGNVGNQVSKRVATRENGQPKDSV